MDTPPEDIKGWYTKAMFFTMQREKANTVATRRRAIIHPHHKSNPQKSNLSKPFNNLRYDEDNKMQLNALYPEKLTEEARKECMKKGLCLRCIQPGHKSFQCKVKFEAPKQRVAKIEEVPESDDEEIVANISS